VGALLISSALAAATTVALSNAPLPAESTVVINEPAAQWIDVWTVDSDGNRERYECLARTGIVATDIVVIKPVELDPFKQDTCIDFQRPRTWS